MIFLLTSTVRYLNIQAVRQGTGTLKPAENCGIRSFSVVTPLCAAPPGSFYLGVTIASHTDPDNMSCVGNRLPFL